MRISDWSSDVCSSDLSALRLIAPFTELNVHGAENPQITFQWEVDTDLSQIDKYETQLFVSALRPGQGLWPDDNWPDRRLLLGEEDPNLPANLKDFNPNRIFTRSDEHTSEPQPLMRNSYAVF